MFFDTSIVSNYMVQKDFLGKTLNLLFQSSKSDHSIFSFFV